MAKINFIYRGKSETGKLSIRLTHGLKDNKNIDIRVSSSIVSKKDYWLKRTTKKSGKTGLKHLRLNELPNNGTPNYKEHKQLLEKLVVNILSDFVRDFNNGAAITSDWLKETIENNILALDTKKKQLTAAAEQKQIADAKKELEDRTYSANLMSNAIKSMFIKYKTNKDELKKYKTTFNKFCEFQTSQNTIFKTIDLNQEFADKFINWALIENRHKKAYINAVLKRLRYSVVNVYENDDDDIIRVSKKLRSFKMLKNVNIDKEVVNLNYDEIDQIDNTKVDDNLLDAKKAILIGCETGLRYSDFNKLNDANIENVEGVNYWQFRTEKTKALVHIVISERIIDLLTRYGLPKTKYPNDDIKLNRDIKIVCRYAKLNQVVKGSKQKVLMINGRKQKRNVSGLYKKHKLITTRSFRRSFATNYYGKIKTEFITAITGHADEKSLRVYLNKKDDSNIVKSKEQIDAFHKERKEKKENIKLTIIPKAI